MEERIREIRVRKTFKQCAENKHLRAWLTHIGYTEGQLPRVVEHIEKVFVSEKPIVEVEKELHQFFWASAPQMDQRLREEEELVFREIDPYLPAGSIVDIGCGSGRIAQKLYSADRPVQLVDVVEMHDTSLPFKKYDGQTLPFSDGAFCSATVLTVLHHCDDPERVLSEAIRVVSDRLIVIESVFVNDEERLLNMLFDWFWNRVVYLGINVPFNFDHPVKWAQRFEQKGLRVVYSEDLGYDSAMTPEHHWLYVLQK